VQSDHADASTPGFVNALRHESLGEAASAILGLDKDVQHVAAQFSRGIEKVRRPVQHEKPRGSDIAVSVADDPAFIFTVGEHAPHPRLEVAAHLIEDRLGRVPHICEHRLPMAGDQVRVVDRGSPRLQHRLSIESALPAASFALHRVGFFNHAATPYHPIVRTLLPLPLDTSLLKPGMRLAVGLSGGADSVALLCALVERSRELGLVLHAAHLHHGLRGEEADADLEFCRDLAAGLGLPFHEARVDTGAEARRTPRLTEGEGEENSPSDSIEGTARRLRYQWFRKLLSELALDAVATAHTLDDQAETVLAKFLRGAWTEGLSGIHPSLEGPEGGGPIIRPLLRTTRGEIEAFLNARKQPWREDSTNRHLTFTRNRIRHELLPQLTTWNPRLRDHLTQMAELARDEETWWQSEVARVAEQVILRGRPVRGGGRATTAAEGIALDLARLVAEPVAVQRRLLRYAAAQLEAAPDFSATEALRSLAQTGKAGQKLELAQGLRADRTHREIRLLRSPNGPAASYAVKPEQYECVIPGEVSAPAFGCRIRIDVAAHPVVADAGNGGSSRAVLRSWRPGDRVHLRHSSGQRKVKEVLERMKVTGGERIHWPVLEVAREVAGEVVGRIVWMRGVELEPDPSLRVSVEPMAPGHG
jgi:tRNA(Ile)-lysidine synthase